jgi:hypothetical protein
MNVNEETVSSFCSGGDCLAVTYKTSSFCHSGGCVEVGMPAGEVLVRDTKDRTRPPAVFSPSAWVAFTAGVKAGEFSDAPDSP